MVVLDTDHLTLLQWEYDSPRNRLQTRLDELGADQKGTSIISYEEQIRGWLAHVSQARTMADQIRAYAKLQRHLESFQRIPVVGFDEAAVSIFQRLKKSRLRVGTMDLKIAAITLAHNATLLTRNSADFRLVPGLKFEDWTI